VFGGDSSLQKHVGHRAKREGAGAWSGHTGCGGGVFARSLGEVLAGELVLGGERRGVGKFGVEGGVDSEKKKDRTKKKKKSCQKQWVELKAPNAYPKRPLAKKARGG